MEQRKQVLQTLKLSTVEQRILQGNWRQVQRMRGKPREPYHPYKKVQNAIKKHHQPDQRWRVRNFMGRKGQPVRKKELLDIKKQQLLEDGDIESQPGPSWQCNVCNAGT